MPDPALPERRNVVLGTVRYRRVFQDALQRPLSGKVTLTGSRGVDANGTKVVVAPVTVELVNGVLDVSLLPDRYTFSTKLQTVDGVPVIDQGTIDLAADDA